MRTFSRIITTLVFVLGVASVASSQSISACYQVKNGQLRVVRAGEFCLPSELAISWSAAGSRDFTIVDSRGKTVGYPATLEDYVDGLDVVMSIGGDWVKVPASTSGFTTGPESVKVFSTPDCSGDFLMIRSTLAFVQTGLVVEESGVPVIYVPGRTTDPNIDLYYESDQCHPYFHDEYEVATIPNRIVLPKAVPPFTLVR